jgi:hypothetical protein
VHLTLTDIDVEDVRKLSAILTVLINEKSKVVKV